jgi:hypothetical protein
VIARRTALPEVAGSVAAVLRSIDLDPVVVGGSAVTLHVPSIYTSLDIDMVIVEGIDEAHKVPLVNAMKTLGFSLENQMFVHRESPYTVDFVPGPVQVGDDVIVDYATIETAVGAVRVLRPVDSVCDRLTKYVAWRDIESLDLAVAVARHCGVRPEDVQSFVERHDKGLYGPEYRRGYERFLRELVPFSRIESTHGFTTILRVRFSVVPRPQSANDVMMRVQSLLDERRMEIAGLDGVAIGGDPIIQGNVVSLPLALRTIGSFPFVDRMRIALDSIAYLRSRLSAFPELVEIIDDEAPPIAATGW